MNQAQDAMLSDEASTQLNITAPGRLKPPTQPLVNAPIIAPSGTAEYIRPTSKAPPP